jgi:hypothetical protein
MFETDPIPEQLLTINYFRADFAVPKFGSKNTKKQTFAPRS